MTPAQQAAQGLLQYLKRLQRGGKETIALTAEAATNLSRVSQAIATQPTPPSAPAQTPTATQTYKTPAATAPASEAPARVQETPAELKTETPPAAAPTTPSSEDKRPKLRDIAKRSKRCEATKALGTLRDQFVFAVGNPDARLMLIGEAPGAHEETKHEPFVGPAGQLLDKIVGAMGLQRGDLYISNIVKFRPIKGDGANQGSANRKPTPTEMATSVQYVREEIKVVAPDVIVALGGTAMEGLLGLEGGVGANRSRFHDLDGTPVMVTYHPSYLLRSDAPAEKRKVWEDLLLVMEKLGMPISEKQRGYFQ